eukprot:s863_g21.t1
MILEATTLVAELFANCRPMRKVKLGPTAVQFFHDCHQCETDPGAVATVLQAFTCGWNRCGTDPSAFQ